MDKEMEVKLTITDYSRTYGDGGMGDKKLCDSTRHIPYIFLTEIIFDGKIRQYVFPNSRSSTI